MPETAPRRARRPRMLDRCPVCGQENVPAARCPARCGHCDACCTCGGTAPENTKNWSSHAAFFPEECEPDALIPRYTSVEIEFVRLARYGHHLSALVHGRQHGHTLTDASCGYEVNTAPARGALFAENLQAICDLMEAGKVEIDKRCGLHVHVNVGGVKGARNARHTSSDRDGGEATYMGLLVLALLWARVEKAIAAMISDSRLDSTFCQMHGDHFVDLAGRRAREQYHVEVAAGDAIGVCLAVAEHFTEEDARWVIDYGLYGHVGAVVEGSCYPEKNPIYDHPFWKNTARTTAMNLHSAFYHGTVEFRVHQGSTNYDKILYWSALCAGLVHYALTHTAEDVALIRGTPAEIIDRAVRNPQVAAWRKTRFAFFYEKRSAKKNGGEASRGARVGGRVRRQEPALRAEAPPIVPEPSER